MSEPTDAGKRGDPDRDGLGREGGRGHPPCRHPAVIWEALDAEVTLFLPGSSDAHILNPAAALIWSKCDGNHRIEDLVEALMDRYGIDHQRARVDVAACIARLRTLGLLVDVDARKSLDQDA
ncbi:MAG: PqqD family protein [Chloroflexi bacterium]|nr:PqqD family protein [Chloroflexota bacterium]